MAELLGELKGRRRTVPQAAVQLREVIASLGSGLTEQANPRNLIFGICKIEEPAAEIADRSERREFRELGTDFHPIRKGPSSHGCATMRKGLGRRFCLCVTGSLNFLRPCSPILWCCNC